MRIVFLTPFPAQGGGNRVVAQYANGLAALGHDVSVVSTRQKAVTLTDSIRSWIKNRRAKKVQSFSDAFSSPKFKHIYAQGTDVITDADIPECDAIVATWWETAYWLNNLTKKPPRLFYFMQDYGVGGMEMDRLIPTWFMPFKIITIAPWMKRLIHSCNPDKDVTVIENGVDRIFALDGYRASVPALTFGHVFSAFPTKGSKIVIEAFAQVQKEHPSATLTCFGGDRPHAVNIPGFEYHHSPNTADLINFYKSCRSWIFSSRAEGFGLPILEAFAAGTPVVATPVGIAPGIITPANGVLLNGFGVSDIVEGMKQMIAVPDEQWLAMSKNCIDISKNYDWDRLTKAFESEITAAY